MKFSLQYKLLHTHSILHNLDIAYLSMTAAKYCFLEVLLGLFFLPFPDMDATVGNIFCELSSSWICCGNYFPVFLDTIVLRDCIINLLFSVLK